MLWAASNVPQWHTAPESSSGIVLDSFWELFLIAGGASVSALINYAAIFLYQHRQVLSHCDYMTSWWNKVVALSRQFDHKDMSSHTFKKSQFWDISTGAGHIRSDGVSPHPKSSQGQMSFSFPNDPEAAITPDQSDPSPTRQGQTSPEIWVTPVDIYDPPTQGSSQVPHVQDASEAP